MNLQKQADIENLWLDSRKFFKNLYTYYFYSYSQTNMSLEILSLMKKYKSLDIRLSTTIIVYARWYYIYQDSTWSRISTNLCAGCVGESLHYWSCCTKAPPLCPIITCANSFTHKFFTKKSLDGFINDIHREAKNELDLSFLPRKV